MSSYLRVINDLQSGAEQKIINFLKKNSPDEAYEIISYCENAGLFAPGYDPYIFKIRLAHDPDSDEDRLYVIWQTDRGDDPYEGVYDKETHSFEKFEQGDWTPDIPMYNIFDIADSLKNK